MKSLIIGIAIFFISMTFTVFQQDYNLHQQHLYNLKFTAQEASAAAAQYIVNDYYKEGMLVFNQSEGTKAAEYIIQKQLKVDENLLPLAGSYWRNQVNYQLEFFDDSNSTFPFLYTHYTNSFTLTIREPTVIVTIDAGKPRYRIFTDLPNSIRVAAHEWKGR